MYLFFAILAVLVLEGPAWAVQVHGPPEGLYVHILAHIFFSAALIFILVLFKKNPPGKGPPWRFLKLSLFLFLLWNLDTLTVHLLSMKISEVSIHMPSDVLKHKLLPPITAKEILYYVLRNDHFLCVPAMIFLVMSLRSFATNGMDGQYGEEPKAK